MAPQTGAMRPVASGSHRTARRGSDAAPRPTATTSARRSRSRPCPCPRTGPRRTFHRQGHVWAECADPTRVGWAECADLTRAGWAECADPTRAGWAECADPTGIPLGDLDHHGPPLPQAGAQAPAVCVCQPHTGSQQDHIDVADQGVQHLGCLHRRARPRTPTGPATPPVLPLPRRPSVPGPPRSPIRPCARPPPRKPLPRSMLPAPERPAPTPARGLVVSAAAPARRRRAAAVHRARGPPHA